MNQKFYKFLGVAAAASFAVTSLAACGSDNATGDKSGNDKDSSQSSESVSGSIKGAGASSQEAAMTTWTQNFMSNNPDAQITYASVGSGAGIEQFVSKQVAWAGSDAYLEGDEVQKAKDRCGADAYDLPTYISPVAVVFNLKETKELNLDPDVVAKIFKGEIKKWNDPAITKSNPDANLPDLDITPVHRSDKSGTTENFTSYLNEAAPDVWPDKADKTWPISGGETGDKTAGMIQAVQGTEGTIGYADASQAGDALGVASLKSGDGYTAPTQESAAKAADIAEAAKDRADGDLALNVVRVPKEEGAYPLILISYEIVCSKYEKEEGNVVKAFMEYVTSEEGQKAASEAAGSAPISNELREKIQKSLDKIKIG
ncbi:phosphate ABC transporter, phosphate-binding protein PstS [Winkia neuii]|uniref:phosphate ABC transporter substrate-binding protein PstS n=1 Tax=Winkia neuii TaxID=33007 RepID=UPI000763F9B0|nr:phosphate ABC transporter substrate-binding protein PstS [Winkia neuii]KWZ72794.1 phosphate ABC transporter, phosphate-binding protein PstS [Winkia neuii]